MCIFYDAANQILLYINFFCSYEVEHAIGILILVCILESYERNVFTGKFQLIKMYVCFKSRQYMREFASSFLKQDENCVRIYASFPKGHWHSLQLRKYASSHIAMAPPHPINIGRLRPLVNGTRCDICAKVEAW